MLADLASTDSSSPRSRLEAAYSAPKGTGTKPRTDDVDDPPPSCARMCGRTALVIRITPKKFTSNTRWACSMELSSAAPPAPTPALLTSTSIRPNRPIT